MDGLSARQGIIGFGNGTPDDQIIGASLYGSGWGHDPALIGTCVSPFQLNARTDGEEVLATGGFDAVGFLSGADNPIEASGLCQRGQAQDVIDQGGG